MPKRTTTFYLVKLSRVSAWLLLLLMLLYIVTGFALCGKYGVQRLIDTQFALLLHKIFDWPLVVLFLIHAGVSAYLALRRWGWLKSQPTC